MFTLPFMLAFSDAQAWNWRGYDWVNDPQNISWRFGNSPPGIAGWAAGEQNAVRSAIEEWKAGLIGDPIPGAFHQNYENGTASWPVSFYNNGANDVYKRDLGWFISHFMGNALSAAIPENLIGNHADIAFRDGVAWCTSFSDPAVGCAVGTFSLKQNATHQWGKLVGFNNDNDVLAAMNSRYPFFGGDTGSSVHEDDVDGMQAKLPGGVSSGSHFFLTAYRGDGTGNSRRIWPPGATVTYSLSSGWVAPPAKLLAEVFTTSAQVSTIEWRLTTTAFAAPICEGPNTTLVKVLGHRTPTMGTNTPYPVEPYSWDFSGVSPGTYDLCAKYVTLPTGATAGPPAFTAFFVNVVP